MFTIGIANAEKDCIAHHFPTCNSLYGDIIPADIEEFSSRMVAYLQQMGFLDKFRKKKEDTKATDAQSSMKTEGTSEPSRTGRRIKKYTSDGKPL